MSDSIICPISTERISESIVRKVATQVTLLSVVYFLFPTVLIPLFLAFDFAIRSFTELNISVLGNIAKVWNRKFPPSQSKMTDRAPKRFAAGVGFVFSLVIAFTFALGFVKTSFIVTFFLAICASLEAFLSICVGCYVYTFLNLAKFLEKNTIAS
jgi:Domain of unknown function (DUF4395)